MDVKRMTRDELNRALASARNRRDAFAVGRESAEVLKRIRVLTDELTYRRVRRNQVAS